MNSLPYSLPNIVVPNISYTELGFCAALANQTELAFSRKTIYKRYPVKFKNKTYADVHAAYIDHAISDTESNDILMSSIILAKLQQHPELPVIIEKLGTLSWLNKCSHFNHNSTVKLEVWEGQGIKSRFIRNLISSWKMFDRSITPIYVAECHAMA